MQAHPNSREQERQDNGKCGCEYELCFLPTAFRGRWGVHDRGKDERDHAEEEIVHYHKKVARLCMAHTSMQTIFH